MLPNILKVRLVYGNPFSGCSEKNSAEPLLHCSGILTVNAHAEVNLYNLNEIDSFILYSSTTKLSNGMQCN